ncbi:uncharacterized protein METZ01_LOCUS452285, partial [marine metagenome]
LKLPPSIKSSVKTGEISAGHARALLSLRKSLQMMTLYQKVLKEGLSVRQTEVLSKKYTEKSSKKLLIKKGSKLQIQVKDLENSLISSLGAKVVVKQNKKGKGKIYIDFDDDDDLQRIIKIITVKK